MNVARRLRIGHRRDVQGRHVADVDNVESEPGRPGTFPVNSR